MVRRLTRATQCIVAVAFSPGAIPSASFGQSVFESLARAAAEGLVDGAASALARSVAGAPYEFVATRDVQAMGTAGRQLYLRAGGQIALLISDQPASGDWTARDTTGGMSSDQSWYSGQPGTRPIVVTVKEPSHTEGLLISGGLDPTTPLARLAAANYSRA